MQKITLPYQALEIMQRLFDHHYKSYVAGAAVRELLTGGMPLDYDIITDCSVERIITIFSSDYRIKEENARSGEIIIMVRGMAIMVSPFRETFDEDSRPIYTEDVLKELSRRDFTINTICADMNGELFDPFGGVQCLQSEPYVLSAVESRNGNDEVLVSSVKNDPVVLMTALALMSEGDYVISGKTSADITESVQSVLKMRRNELRLLFERLIMGKRAGEVLFEYKNVVFAIFPELTATDGFEMHSRMHTMTLYDHVCKSIGFSVPSLELRYALLFHGLGKPDCEALSPDGYATFYGHSQRASIYARHAMIRLNAPPDLVDEVCFLIENHDVCEDSHNVDVSELKKDFGISRLRNILLLGSANLRAKNPELEAEAYALRKLSEQLSQW